VRGWPAISSLGNGVLLLGMHRSGTSVATRMLALMGVGLPRGELIPADADNARGYWESRALSAFNERLLEHVGGCWYAPPDLRGAVAALEPHRDEGQTLWRQEFSGQDSWVWKDPRLCLLLPFWHVLLPPPAARLLVHRQPLQIADSLLRRNNLSVPYSLALWERYLREALLACDGQVVHVEAYERLLDDPRGWLERVAAHLTSAGLPLDTGTCDPTDELLQPRAPGTTESFLHESATPRQLELLELLRSVSGSSFVVDSSSLPPESPTTEPILDQARQAWSTHRALAAADRRYTRDIAELRAALDAADGTATDLAAQRAQLQEEVDGCRTEAHRATRELELAGRELAAVQERLDLAQRERAAVLEQLELMRSSTSWRLTRPLRQVGGLRQRG
jgi:hypothetical protein